MPMTPIPLPYVNVAKGKVTCSCVLSSIFRESSLPHPFSRLPQSLFNFKPFMFPLKGTKTWYQDSKEPNRPRLCMSSTAQILSSTTPPDQADHRYQKNEIEGDREKERERERQGDRERDRERGKERGTILL